MYRLSEKNLLSSNISHTCAHNMLNFGPLVSVIFENNCFMHRLVLMCAFRSVIMVLHRPPLYLACSDRRQCRLCPCVHALKDETRVVAVERGVLEVDHVTQSTTTTTTRSSAGCQQRQRLTATGHHRPVIYRVSCGQRLPENGQLALSTVRSKRLKPNSITLAGSELVRS